MYRWGSIDNRARISGPSAQRRQDQDRGSHDRETHVAAVQQPRRHRPVMPSMWSYERGRRQSDERVRTGATCEVRVDVRLAHGMRSGSGAGHWDLQGEELASWT
jgi:hypothetical protein